MRVRFFEAEPPLARKRKFVLFPGESFPPELLARVKRRRRESILGEGGETPAQRAKAFFVGLLKPPLDPSLSARRRRSRRLASRGDGQEAAPTRRAASFLFGLPPQSPIVPWPRYTLKVPRAARTLKVPRAPRTLKVPPP